MASNFRLGNVNITGVREAMESFGRLANALQHDERLMIKLARFLKRVLEGRVKNKGNYLVSQLFVKNADATIYRKGFDHPYLQTGELLQQIVMKKKSSGFFVGVEGSKAYVASILEFGATIEVTPKMRAWWAVNFPKPLAKTTTKIVIPPRFLFLDIMRSAIVKKKLSNMLSQEIHKVAA